MSVAADSGERRLLACSCRQLAGNIWGIEKVFARDAIQEDISASCRDGQAGSLRSPEKRK
jgi:hypothetical protein